MDLQPGVPKLLLAGNDVESFEGLTDVHLAERRCSMVAFGVMFLSGLALSRWATGKLLKSAYDGVVRRMDPQRGEFELLLAGDNIESLKLLLKTH